MTGYVIATDSRRKNEVLFMVDRRRQRASFWSNRTFDAMVYADKTAAKAKAGTFRFNRPRVMTLADAQRIAVAQAHAHDDEVDGDGPGWDSHKGHSFGGAA